MRINESQLRRIIKRSVEILLERGDYRRKRMLARAAATVSKEMDVSAGPSAMRAFLNGPGKDKKVRAVLASGKTDGLPTDESYAPKEVAVAVGGLVPTQKEIELTKSIAYPLAVFKNGIKKMCGGGTKAIGPPNNDKIVISGNLIVDGHHRWSSLFSIGGPEAVIAAYDLALPETDAASVLAAVQVAVASTLTGGQPLPAAAAGASNILGKGKDEIKKMIEGAVKSGTGEKGPMLVDGFVDACIKDSTVSAQFGLTSDMSVEDARAAIIEKVSDNLGQLPQPASGSPPRDDMPQLDKAEGGQQGVLDAFASGKVNYKEPFAPGEKSAKTQESTSRRDNLILERWQKLAGLIK